MHSISERLLQYLVGLMLHVVDWETRLRSGNLTISHLKYELDETLRTLCVLDEAVALLEASRDCGEALDELWNLSFKYQHVGPLKQVCDAILIAGLDPFIGLVSHYCTHGSTDSDVFEEVFLKRIHTEFSVEGLRSCPSRLKDYSDLITRSGTNTSLLNSLGHQPLSVVCPETRVFITDEHLVAKFFTECVSTSSSKLFRAIDSASSIPKAIRWFHQHLLLVQADWFSDLIEKFLPILEKPLKLVDCSQIDEFLATVPRSPLSETHAFAIEDMFGPGGCFKTLNELKEETTSIPLMRAFTLNPRIEFPLTLVFCDSAIFKYQSVFRILSYARIVSIKLGRLWLDFQSFKFIGDGCVLFSANILLKKMTHFVNNYLFFLNVDVVRVGIAKLHEDIRGTENIESVKQSVETCIDEILIGCCISPVCVRSVNKVLGTCLLFASHMSRFVCMQSNTDEDELIRITQEEQYIGLIAKFEDAFQGQLNSLLVQLKHYVGGDRTRALALVAKIDYNDYYSETIGL